jgi:hypothetical protein
LGFVVVHAQGKAMGLPMATMRLSIGLISCFCSHMRREWWFEHFQARKGEDICGPGFAPQQKCIQIEQTKMGTITCPQGSKIATVLIAAYGKMVLGQDK